MQNAQQLISNFVRSLEFHPNGQEIITLVESILNNDTGTVDPSIITSLKKLSQDNVSLLIDFWILRASILKEEGRDQEAIRMFIEAPQWYPNDLSVWLRIIDFFINQQEYLKASFFLLEAQKHIDAPGNLNDDYNQVFQQLTRNLELPPGIKSPDLDTQSMEKEGGKYEEISSTEVLDSVSSKSHVDSKQHNFITSEVTNLWDQAFECFEEGINGNNIIYLQAFIHYAHSTIREILGLDGNFKNGLDRQVAKFGLFEHKNFFIKLNRLRTAVIHENYVVSKEEAEGIFSRIATLLKKADY